MQVILLNLCDVVQLARCFILWLLSPLGQRHINLGQETSDTAFTHASNMQQILFLNVESCFGE
jgi:hypothetical protein